MCASYWHFDKLQHFTFRRKVNIRLVVISRPYKTKVKNSPKQYKTADKEIKSKNSAFGSHIHVRMFVKIFTCHFPVCQAISLRKIVPWAETKVLIGGWGGYSYNFFRNELKNN